MAEKIYISGIISGVSVQEYTNRFLVTEMKLTELGYDVVNPVKIGRLLPINSKWSDYLRADILELMKCNGIYMLLNWRDSRGAKIEKRLAEDLGFNIMFELDEIRKKN